MNESRWFGRALPRGPGIRFILVLALLAPGMTCPGSTQPHAMAASDPASTGEPARETRAEGWEVTSLEAEGLDPSRFELLIGLIREDVFRKVDGIVVARHGKILVEKYFHGYGRDDPHEIRSATKSISSALVGIAIDQGHIPGVGDGLYRHFQEREPLRNQDERKSRITLENLLNMTTGLDCDDMDSASAGNETNVLETEDITRFMLDLPMAHEPGEHWAYGTGIAHLAGSVIESATGTTVQEFARTFLFEPLGMAGYGWKTSGGIAHTGGGFRMRPVDMAKFGQLYLDRGRWQGRQVLSEEWIDATWKSRVPVTGDFGYGYLWWRRTFEVDGRPFPALAAQGNGENNIFVLPDLELVVVLSGSAFGEIYGPAQTAMMMTHYILPAVVQDIDPHTGEPDLRGVPEGLFALSGLLFVSALIFWPVGFVVRRIRAWMGRSPKDDRSGFCRGLARAVAWLDALIILGFLALFLSDAKTLGLFLNSGMSHPLGILEVFLGAGFIKALALIVWSLSALIAAQTLFLVRAFKGRWWSSCQRWHYAALTLGACHFVLVMLWWGFGGWPS